MRQLLGSWEQVEIQGDFVKVYWLQTLVTERPITHG